jgi:hypothetical protein
MHTHFGTCLHRPVRYKFSPYLGAPQPERDILLFHRGRMGLNDAPAYSRGVRQRVRGGAGRGVGVLDGFAVSCAG